MFALTPRRDGSDAAATRRPIGSIVEQMDSAFAGPAWRRDPEPADRKRHARVRADHDHVARWPLPAAAFRPIGPA